MSIRYGTKAIKYEVCKGGNPTIKYFHIFCSKCYILLDREQRRNMDPKRDEGIFLGYSINSGAFRVYNNHTKTMMESISVVINDNHEDK